MHAQLSADLVVSDPYITVLVDGSGNCIEIEEGVVAIGSGGLYAQSAALAMIENDDYTAEEIARKAMKIAGDLCVYTNHNVTIEVIEAEVKVQTPPVLGYWPIRGRAASIRYLFGYLGVDFIQEVYEQGGAPDFSKTAWLDQKFNLGLDFPNLPYLIDGDVKLT